MATNGEFAIYVRGLRKAYGTFEAVKGIDFEPDRQKQRLKDRSGVCLQATNLPDKITVTEALQLFGAFYTRNVDGAALLRRLQLDEKKDARYATLSGGQ